MFVQAELSERELSEKQISYESLLKVKITQIILQKKYK